MVPYGSKDAGMGAKAFLGRFQRDLEPLLVERVAAARRDDPFAPLHVLVGSNLLGVYLKRRLAERLGGLFNVRFGTFADAAEIIAAGASRVPLPARADRVLVESLLSTDAVPSCFGEAAGTNGFADTLILTFTDLVESGCTPEIARRLAARPAARCVVGERARGVLSLFADFREAVERLGGDVHSLFGDARSVTEFPLRGARVFAYGFYDFNEMQWRLLSRFAAECELTLFMPWDRKETYRFCERTKQRLEQGGFETVVVVGVDRAEREAVRPKLLDVPGEEEEVREIVRRILALARGQAVRFGDVAILIPSMDAYPPLLREVLTEAGVPYSVSAGFAGEADASVRGALGLLELLRGTMERRDLIEFIVSAPLRSPDAVAKTLDHVSRWVRMSAEAGMIGEAGWSHESGALVRRLRSDVEAGKGSGDDLAAALHVDALIQRVTAARETAKNVSTWSGRAHALSALVRDLFEANDDTEKACGIIDGLARLDRIEGSASFETFSRIAEAELAGSAPPVGRFGGEGVNILTLGQARGLTFETVFIPGLAERVFPTMVRQDPLLSDAERREINRLSRGEVSLPEKLERLSEETLLFETAVDSARRSVVLSFPRFEEGTGKERIPSSFLRFIEGYALDGRHGDELDAERVSRDAWAGRLEPGTPGSPPLSEHEFDLARAVGYLNGSGALPDALFFSRGARLVQGRWGTRKFTAYDGVFSSKKALGALREMLEEARWRFAPTALEGYAKCPFEYFLSRVLEIEILEEPERIVSITPLQRGTLIHTILAGVFGELKRTGLLPVCKAPAERVFEVAGRVIARVLEEFPKTEPVGFPVFWEVEKRSAEESVRLLLEEERREETGLVPSHFEQWFGWERDGHGVSCECGGRTILFCGRIDRIDADGGGAFRVIDYKTGKLSGPDQDFGCGTTLQLPIYLMAASRILGRPLEHGTALYRHVGPGEGRDSVVFSGAHWEENKDEFTRIVDVITRGIETGIFFAPADGLACRNCGMSPACPVGMSRLFALKAAHDARSREYLELREGSAVSE
jgi:ATP-dependent helicase/nuclease subunit B